MNTNSINVDGKSYYTPRSKGDGIIFDGAL